MKKKVSEKELARLKKKGKVRKKMGAQPPRKTPEPEPTVTEDMSGSAADSPAPDLTQQPMAAMAASNAAGQALMQDLVDRNTAAIAEFSSRLDNMKPQELSNWQKADFIRHKVNRSDDKLIDFIDSIPMKRKTG